MRQDVDAVMTKTEARERGYLPTAEGPALPATDPALTLDMLEED